MRKWNESIKADAMASSIVVKTKKATTSTAEKRKAEVVRLLLPFLPSLPSIQLLDAKLSFCLVFVSTRILISIWRLFERNSRTGRSRRSASVLFLLSSASPPRSCSPLSFFDLPDHCPNLEVLPSIGLETVSPQDSTSRTRLVLVPLFFPPANSCLFSIAGLPELPRKLIFSPPPKPTFERTRRRSKPPCFELFYPLLSFSSFSFSPSF